MSDRSSEGITQLLGRLSTGDQAVVEDLLPIVYDELRALAGSFFRAQRPNHTLQPTALVHEAYMRLIGQTQTEWANRTHFFAVAASAMRRILADHARSKRTQKRGGHWHRVTLDEAVAPLTGRPLDVLDLDGALTKLAALDKRQAQLVELRFFGGLTNEAAAKVLRVSRKTVANDWTVARLWLRRELCPKSDS